MNGQEETALSPAASLDLSDPRLLAALLAAADDAIVITEAEPIDDPHPRIVYANEGYLRMTGYTLDEVIGNSPRLAQGPGTDRTTLDRIRSCLKTWQPFREELLNYRKDGTPFWVELAVRPIADENGWYTHWVSIQRDVTQRRETTDALAEHARDLEEAQQLAKLGTWSWNAAEDTFRGSSEALAMLNLDPDRTEFDWREILPMIKESDRDTVQAAFDRIALLGESVTFEFQAIKYSVPFQTIWAEGHPQRDENGVIIAVRGLCQDVTERRHVERRLLWSGTHDSLTGLLNMEGLRSQMPALLARARASGRSVVVGLVDLDNLKLVNDTLGHKVGDALIAEASRRLVAALGQDTFIARFGGDEFVFVQCCSTTCEQRESRFQDIVDLLKTPFDYEGRELDCTASVGVVVSKPELAELDVLLQNADLAMYRAKETGRGAYAFFSSDLQEGVERRVAHLDLARLALGGKLVVPHFQPQVSLSTGEVVGYEALLRLQIAHEIMPPSAVEHAFENVELAARLGDEMLRRVLSQIRLWRAEGFDFGKVGVNVSAAELLRKNYADRVLEALERAEVPPGFLEIEVTEGVLFGRGAERCADTLRTLRAAGIGIALDDFGTGYASLTHLKSLPITRIKIDKGFVDHVAENESDAAIVRAVVKLAQALSLDVVAEGVETRQQAEFLKECECDIAQGYLFGRAIAGKDIALSRTDVSKHRLISRDPAVTGSRATA